jgi:Undecaprenyl-phosphate glucose phosphotransferase
MLSDVMGVRGCMRQIVDNRGLERAGRIARYFGVSYHGVERATLALEAALVVAASVLGNVSYFHLWLGTPGDLEVALGIGVFDGLIYAFLAHNWGLYRFSALMAPARFLGRVVLAWASAFLIIALVLFLLKVGANFSRGSMLTFAVYGLALLAAGRWLFGRYLTSAVAQGLVGGRRAVVIGEGEELATLGASQLLERFGIVEVARVLVAAPPDDLPALPRSELAKVDRALDLARDGLAEEFVVAVRWTSTALLELVRERLRMSPLPVRLLPDRVVRGVLGRRAGGAGLALAVELQRGPLTRAERGLKRSIDFIAASAILILLSPLMVITALAIRLESPGPVIFRQRRNGFNGRQFVIYKFRSMTALEDGPLIAQARRNDPRVTRLGRLLRRTSIDELPQLINVVRGDMSIVGPRPHAIAHDDEYGSVIAKYAFRHHVKPGITGWAQIHGYRGETARVEQMMDRVELDLWYINNWSLVLDLRIALRTLLEVLGNRNAY